jgi:hypothetical protein
MALDSAAHAAAWLASIRRNSQLALEASPAARAHSPQIAARERTRAPAGQTQQCFGRAPGNAAIPPRAPAGVIS